VDRTIKVLVIIGILFLLTSCSNKKEEQRSAEILNKLNGLENEVQALEFKIDRQAQVLKSYMNNDEKLYQEIENLCLLLKSALLMNQMQKEVNEK